MDTTIQIIAFYFVSVALIGFAALFASHKHFRLSGVILTLSFASFVLAQFMGKGLSMAIHGLTLEQILCWVFGFFFLCLAVYFIHEKALAYGFALCIIAVVSCFFGFSSVQALMKSHLLWMVSDTLNSYGNKIETYQIVNADIQKRLADKQAEFETNQQGLVSQMVKQKDELDAVQSKIRDAELTILGQQSDITNQYLKLSLIQSDLTTAQTNLDAQQKALSTVEFWVKNWIDMQRTEELTASQTNKLTVIWHTNLNYMNILIRLNEVPIPNSFEVSVYDRVSRFPGKVRSFPVIGNIIGTGGLFGYDSNSLEVAVKYVADTRETNSILPKIPEGIIKMFQSY